MVYRAVAEAVPGAQLSCGSGSEPSISKVHLKGTHHSGQQWTILMVVFLLGLPKEALLKPLLMEVMPLKTSVPLTCPSHPSPSCSFISHLHPPLACTRPRGAGPVES